MNPCIKEQFDRNGELVRAEFFPTADMLRYAAARSSIKNEERSDVELLKELGIPRNSIKRWHEENGVHFTSWLAWFMESSRAPVRDALFAVGLDRAMRGEYNFWKDMARTVGAISSEKQDVHLVVSKGVDELASLTPAQLQLEQQRLLSELTGTSKVVETSQGEEQSGSIPGASQVQDGPVALPNELDSDGGLPGPSPALQAVPSQTPSKMSF